MKVSFINSHRPNAGSLSLRKHFSNLTLFRLFNIRQQWRRWVGWCSSIQGVFKQASGCLLLAFVLVFSFAACENEDNKLNPPPTQLTSDNPLLGTWYNYDLAIPTGYMKLEFTETNMNVSIHSTEWPLPTSHPNEPIFYDLLVDNADYYLIGEDSIYYEIEYPGYSVPYVWFNLTGGVSYNKTEYTIIEDYLTIKDFFWELHPAWGATLPPILTTATFTREVRYE